MYAVFGWGILIIIIVAIVVGLIYLLNQQHPL